MKNFIAVNWGSSNFRAYHIGSDGRVLNQMNTSDGVTKINRERMVSLIDEMVSTFDAQSVPIYAAGMIGSPVGWLGVGYSQCPTSPNIMASQLTQTKMGNHVVQLVPGLTCKSPTGHPDVMRGEEIELLGLLAEYPQLHEGVNVLAMPGTHTKWVMIKDGNIVSFFTSMSGELFDRLKEKSLLTSVMSSPAQLGISFDRGLEDGESSGSGLCRSLFNVRAQVMTGELETDDSESYARGLLLGGEVADAIHVFQNIIYQNEVLLLGNPSLCKLYQKALHRHKVTGKIVDPNRVSIEGFLQLHNAKSKKIAA